MSIKSVLSKFEGRAPLVKEAIRISPDMLPVAGGAALGAGTGALSGALAAPEGKRLRSSLESGLMGGLYGSLMGAGGAMGSRSLKDIAPWAAGLGTLRGSLGGLIHRIPDPDEDDSENKTAGTPFLEQDRPSKVKEIYSALKRDHPGMAAKMKARIASNLEKEKKAHMLTDSLNTLWLVYTPDPENLEKTAATRYFYDLQKPSLDAEALGTSFCKLASAFDADPWWLACEVEDNINAFTALAKTASDPRAQELAQFYIDWAEGLEKKALLGAIARGGGKLLGKLTGKSGMQAAGQKVTRVARQAGIGGGRRSARSAMKAQRKQMAGKEMARRGAAQAQSRSGAQAALKGRTKGLGPNTSKQQGQLKQRLLSKRRASGQATAIPKPGGPGGAPSKLVKRKRFTTGEKAIGAAAVGVPVVGGMMMAGQQAPQRPAY